MKKFLLSAVGLVALGIGAPASAADLAARPYTKAPPPIVEPMYNWSGFYIGLNGGGGWGHKCWDLINNVGVPVIPADPEGCHDATGGTLAPDRLPLAGGEFLGVRLGSTGQLGEFPGDNVSLDDPLGTRNRSQIDAFGLFTGQIGYAFNNALLYVKGGAAVTSDKYTGIDIPTGIAFDRATETRWGGTVGVGVEYGFSPNWSLALEYDHLFMGTRDVSLFATGAFAPVAGSLSGIDSIRQSVDLFTVRVNYRFGGPVVARY